MNKQTIKPRQLAALMVDEFLDGKQLQIDPNDWPKEIRGTAIAHARNAAALVVFHARKAREDRNHYQTMPDGLRVMTMRYNDARLNKGRAA